MTTKQENSGVRSLEFSRWIRQRLPDSSTGFFVSNQDWIFWNWKTRKLMLCEEKMYMSKVSTCFDRLIKEVLEPALAEFCPKEDIQFKGYFLIQFENSGPEDGKTFLNGQEIQLNALVKFLSMEE